MNYYPNQNYLQSGFAQPNPSFIQPNPIYQPTIPTLNGKLVDGIDMVKSQEIPLGSYGIYPKADLTELYIKSWQNDGTTKIITYKPYIDDNVNNAVGIKPETQILDAIAKLDAKLDTLKSTPMKKENSGGGKQ